MTAARASKATYTAEDLLELEDGDRYELDDDGELVERHASYESSIINVQVMASLGSYVLAHRLGCVTDRSLGLRPGSTAVPCPESRRSDLLQRTAAPDTGGRELRGGRSRPGTGNRLTG